MSVSKIYGIRGCFKCIKAKKLFVDAQYIDLGELEPEEYTSLLNRVESVGQISAPILLDEKDNIILHTEVGL